MIDCLHYSDYAEKDLKIQTKTASGAGGQHVNKTESAVRITHVPSGVMVECQEDRSQIRNRETAMTRLRKILTDRYISEAFEKRSKTRKSQVGQANRNEKIRTYNFNQDRVTDHRLSALNISPSDKEDTQFDLDGFFASADRLEGFIRGLQRVEKEQELLDIFTELDNKK
jgi:peptide chain release factor 1